MSFKIIFKLNKYFLTYLKVYFEVFDQRLRNSTSKSITIINNRIKTVQSLCSYKNDIYLKEYRMSCNLSKEIKLQLSGIYKHYLHL